MTPSRACPQSRSPSSPLACWPPPRHALPGDLDPTFPGDGRQTTDFGGSGGGVQGVAIQGDGKIVAAGTHGSYAIPAVAAGSHRCAASATRYAPGTHSVTVEPGKTTTADFYLARS